MRGDCKTSKGRKKFGENARKEKRRKLLSREGPSKCRRNAATPSSSKYEGKNELDLPTIADPS